MVKWIKKNLGTSSYIDIKNENIHVIDVRDLVDKKGNTPKIIKSKINEALLEIKQGKKVAICCDYGISRSNAIAAGIISIQDNITIENAIRLVLKKTGEKSIKLEVLSDVSNAIKNSSKKKIKKRKSRILVTGSSGFIGKSLVAKLKKHFDVFEPNNKEIDLLEDTVQLDLYVKKNDIDTLIHLANPRIYTTNDSMGKTLTMLKNILDVCKENKLFFLYPSGWEVYSGHTSKKIFANESLIPKPGNSYGLTKMLCESLIQSYNSQFRLKSIIIRSSPVYGENGDKPKFIWNFLKKAFENQTIVTHSYKNGFPKLDLLYIDDLVDVFIKILQKKIEGSINIGTGIDTSTKDIAKMIVKMTNSKSKIQHSKIFDVVGNIVMDSTFAKNKLNWKSRITIEEGLKKIINQASTINRYKQDRRNGQ